MTDHKVPEADWIDEQLDEIFDDLMVGHNFEYAKRAVAKLIIEGQIDQSKLTSNWIDDRIGILARDPDFQGCSAFTAFIYARDQVRQGAYRPVAQLKQQLKDGGKR